MSPIGQVCLFVPWQMYSSPDFRTWTSTGAPLHAVPGTPTSLPVHVGPRRQIYSLGLRYPVVNPGYLL